MLDHTKIKKGDRIRHRLFGTGTVVDTLPLGGDTVVTIEFDSGTTRKLCAVISGIVFEETSEQEKDKDK